MMGRSLQRLARVGCEKENRQLKKLKKKKKTDLVAQLDTSLSDIFQPC